MYEYSKVISYKHYYADWYIGSHETPCFCGKQSEAERNMQRISGKSKGNFRHRFGKLRWAALQSQGRQEDEQMSDRKNFRLKHSMLSLKEKQVDGLPYYFVALSAKSVVTRSLYGARLSSSPASSRISCRRLKLSSSNTRLSFQVSWS